LEIRHRNTLHYRLAHWAIWVFVFFILPWSLTLDLFESGFDQRMLVWLGLVLIGTGLAGLRGRLPGCEPRPYIIRFGEDPLNPFYRRVCYTFAWGAVIFFGVLNAAGLVVAIVTGVWNMRLVYDVGYLPLAAALGLLGGLGWLPRAKSSTEGDGHERRYFYGSVWAMCIAQPTLWLLHTVLPYGRVGDVLKLAVFLSVLAWVGLLSYRGKLPGTRPIVPGERAARG
jgi:hypothetical protein